MPEFDFYKPAFKVLQKLDSKTKERILKKLISLRSHPDINSILKPVDNFSPATHRLRVGQYRLLIKQKNKDTYLVLKVGHRRDIYT